LCFLTSKAKVRQGAMRMVHFPFPFAMAYNNGNEPVAKQRRGTY
jgi:hypothetical protein